MTGDAQLSLTAALDRAYAWTGGESVRYLAVEVTAPTIERDTPPLPVNVALVIDASGSMAGRKLAAAKQAAMAVADGLDERDILSVVSFSDEPILHVDGVRLGASGKSAAANAIARIADRGMTDLSSGWFKGAECAAVVMENNPGLANRVVLLSDGHANGGILDPVVLGKHARELAQRGLQTSTVGVGDGYSETQIAAIAEAGGGRMHDAEHPHEIAEVVLADLREMQATAAELVKVHLAVPPGVRAQCISGFPTEERATTLTAELGAMISGGKRTAYFRLFLPKGHAGEIVALRCSASWRGPGGTAEAQCADVTTRIEFAEGALNSGQPRDVALSEAVARAWQSTVTRKVVQLNAAGARAEIRQYLEQELLHFRKYCAGLPDVAYLVEELELMYQRAGDDWGERNRKELYLMSTNRMYQRVESRRAPRPASKAAFLGGNAPQVFPFELADGHPIANVNGVRCLIDTGAPVSIGYGPVTYGGRAFDLAQSFAGLDIDQLRNLVGSPVDALLGADVLGTSSFQLALDAPAAGRMIAGLPLRGPEWHRLRASFVAGVPIINAVVNGKPQRAFLDTGAKVSYVSQALLKGCAAVGAADDFFPGFGPFSTKLYPIRLRLEGEDLSIHAGELPPALASLLMAGGAEAIIGSSILQFTRLGVDIANGVVATAAR